MTLVEVVGYAATLLNVAGNFMLTRYNIWGWAVRLLVNVLYIAYAAQIELGGPVLLNHLVFVWINLEGIRKWRLSEARA